MDNEVVDPRLTTKIVGSYVGHHVVGTDQVPELITSVHRALSQLGKPAQLKEARTAAVSVRRSVHRDYVVCLDCGYRAKMLRRHISAARSKSGRLPKALGFAQRSSADSASVLSAALERGQGAGAWSQGHRRYRPGRNTDSIAVGRCRSAVPAETDPETEFPFCIQAPISSMNRRHLRGKGQSHSRVPSAPVHRLPRHAVFSRGALYLMLQNRLYRGWPGGVRARRLQPRPVSPTFSREPCEIRRRAGLARH